MRLHFALFVCLASMVSHAQTSQADICRAQTVGLTFTMKTAIGLKQPKDVALDQAGLRTGGPRRQLADHAYTRLAGGASEDTVTSEVNTRCMRLDRDAIARDTTNFEEQDQGSGTQLCADMASSIASFLLEEPGMLLANADELLDRFTSSRPHDDVKPRPELRRALTHAQKHAQANPYRERVADFVLKECRALEPLERALLDAEFYYAN